jgi:hypothetical protein
MNRSTKLIITCTIGLLLLFISTEPGRLPAIALVIPFVFIFALMLTLFMSVFRWRGVATGKSLRLSLMAAALPMLILVLQALGQLTIRDLLTIVALFAITHFYLSRITNRQSD